MTTLSDEELMQLVQQGDLDKLRPLFDRYSVRIYNYCLQLSGERETSKDLTQEVFYKLLKSKTTYRSGSFATWLYAIARNLCYDHYKSRRRTERRIDEFRVFSEREKDTLDHPPGDMDRLHRALQQLSIADRELIVMSKYQGMKYREIAEITDSTVGAVRTKTHRALRKLKDFYFTNITKNEL